MLNFVDRCLSIGAESALVTGQSQCRNIGFQANNGEHGNRLAAACLCRAAQGRQRCLPESASEPRSPVLHFLNPETIQNSPVRVAEGEWLLAKPRACVLDQITHICHARSRLTVFA